MLDTSANATTSLSCFIVEDIEAILAEWEEFARSQMPDAKLDAAVLRDHAREMLVAIADDMVRPQSTAEQHDKARGLESSLTSGIAVAAAEHATNRVTNHFTLPNLVAEFRAMRAAVLRLWLARHPEGGKLEELSRFNEAIDEAIAASVARFDEKLGKSRDIILGVLAHDLRNPLHAASISIQYLLRANDLNEKSTKAAVRALRSIDRMAELIDDLLDYAQTRLGGGLRLNTVDANVAILCGEVIDEIEAAFPGRSVRSTLPTNCEGAWDVSRFKQMVSNLLANAMNHGSADGPVSLVIEPQDTQIAIAIHNEGTPIPPKVQATLFRPVYVEKDHRSRPQSHGSSGLGLGLYIANQIATAHGGTIALTSLAEEGTTFTITVPRQSPV